MIRKLSNTMLRVVLVAVLAAGAMAAPGTGAGTPAQDLNAALRGGDLVAAREALVRWLDLSPDNPRLHYNLACLDARLQEPAAAVASLVEAFRLGFDDVRRADADPDLISLREREDFRELVDGTAAALAADAVSRTVRLPWGSSRPLRLLDAAGRRSPRRSASTKVDGQGLSVDVDLPAGDIVPGDAPWETGGGVVVTVATPGPGEAVDTGRAWRFGFGVRDGLAIGVVLSHPERVVNQAVLDLAPTLDWDAAAGTRTLNIRIPWSHLAPYAPPADTLFGLNVEIVGDGGATTAMLMRDPATGIAEPRPRRFVPLIVVAGPDTPPSLQGRVADTIVGVRPLAIDLTAWFPVAGRSELFTEIQDNDGNSVVTSGDTSADVDLVPGRNDWRRWADLSRLPDGPYRLLATLALNDGTVLTWGTGLFRFGGDWMPRTRDLVKALPDAEKPTILWRVELVSRALVGRDPRRSPAPLITTVAETDRLLVRFRDQGTILPFGGALDAYVPDADGSGHAVRLDTPEGWMPEASADVVLADGPADRTEILRGDLLSGRSAPIVVTMADGAAAPHAAVEAVVRWLRVLLPACRIVLVTDTPSLVDGPETADTQVTWRGRVEDTAAAVRTAIGAGGQ